MAGLITVDHIRKALDLAEFDLVAARQRMAPVPRGWQARDTQPAQAAVMILVYEESDSRLSIALTLRDPDLGSHSGQVSFPGGRQEPNDEDLVAAAIRETWEEIGVCCTRDKVLGQMPCFYIPASHYDVHPIVAHFSECPTFRPNPGEVTEVFGFALEDLLQPRFRAVEQRIIRGYSVHVPYYCVDGHKVWGATAIMLSEFEARLRQALPQNFILEQE